MHHPETKSIMQMQLMIRIKNISIYLFRIRVRGCLMHLVLVKRKQSIEDRMGQSQDTLMEHAQNSDVTTQTGRRKIGFQKGNIVI